MSEALRVLHLLPARPFGGVQVVATTLAEEQRRAGIAASLLFTTADVAARDHAFAAGVPAMFPGAGRGRVRTGIACWSELRRASIDILHLHAPPPWIVPVLATIPARPVVVHLHAGVGPALVHRLAARRLMRRCDAAIAVSRWVASTSLDVLGCGRGKMSVVYNGTGLTPMRRADPDDTSPVFGTATRFESDKGVDAFLEAARRIAHRLPAARFRLAGEGPVRPAAMQRASRELPGRVEFAGFVADIQAFWRDIDVALFTARAEPFGLRLLEPVACEVPVVAFATGAGSDEVAERCRAVLTVPWGEFDGFAEAAARLAAAPHERRRLVDLGRADVDARFSAAAMERGVRAVYGGVLARRHEGR